MPVGGNQNPGRAIPVPGARSCCDVDTSGPVDVPQVARLAQVLAAG